MAAVYWFFFYSLEDEYLRRSLGAGNRVEANCPLIGCLLHGAIRGMGNTRDHFLWTLNTATWGYAFSTTSKTSDPLCATIAQVAITEITIPVTSCPLHICVYLFFCVFIYEIIFMTVFSASFSVGVLHVLVYVTCSAQRFFNIFRDICDTLTWQKNYITIYAPTASAIRHASVNFKINYKCC